MNPVLSSIYRGGRLESVHRGSFVVVGAEGVVKAAGAPEADCFPRSSIKPLQALRLLSSDDFDALELGVEEVACLFASHSGDERHVACVRSLLAKGGVPEDALELGPQRPIDVEAAARLCALGHRARPVHNNCSGKHAGFLIRARALGAPLEGHLDAQHAVQQEVLALLEELSGLSFAEREPAVDGCGAPNWPMPLSALAGLFRDLANPERLPGELRAGATRVAVAMARAPHFVAGRGRFDTALLGVAGGHVLAKCGAEGVFALGLRGDEGRPALGVAIKVDDGSRRGYESFLARLCVGLGIFAGTEATLEPFLSGQLRNTQGKTVGEIRTHESTFA